MNKPSQLSTPIDERSAPDTSDGNYPEPPDTGDGVTHINIYRFGQTELGRMLSQTYNSHFVHPYFGPFHCMEGFWYYVCSVDQPDELRQLKGREVRIFAKNLKTRLIRGFPEIIEVANYHKIAQNPKIREALVNSELPFDHYYFYGPGRVLIRPRDQQRVVNSFTKLRAMFKAGVVPEDPDYSHVTKQSLPSSPRRKKRK